MRYDVCIIGGGVIGCAIARELMRFKLRVVLVEKECEVGFGTSKANSGIIHAGHHSSPKTLKGKLEWSGNQVWDALSDELGFGFKRIGELTVAMDDEQVKTLEHLYDQGQAKGVTGLELWDSDRIRAEEPNLSSDIVAALYAPTAGVVNPYEACFSLIENARQNGLEISVENPVIDITAEADSLWIKTQQELIETQFVINAAGLFADRIADMAGVKTFDIRPRKGEEYLLDKRLKGFVKRLIFPCPTPTSKGILIIPTFDGTLMVGPTALETNDKEDLTTTSAGSDEVFSKVKQVAPGISERDCIAEFAGLRAAAGDEDFIIGTTSLKGFINAAGIQSPGLTASPAIAKMILDILQGEGLELLPNESFKAGIDKPVHVASLSTEAQISLANQDPRYSRIVCRCEHISEGEINDAIHRGARTLDGLKFRTRAGMGLCQGGFCSWRCMQILAEELSLPMTAITKRGGDSWIVLERGQDRMGATS
ncbi:MAG: NAD(P)/FAD-dependent oxidoreductase [Deinococcota bacterium]